MGSMYKMDVESVDHLLDLMSNSLESLGVFFLSLFWLRGWWLYLSWIFKDNGLMSNHRNKVTR